MSGKTPHIGLDLLPYGSPNWVAAQNANFSSIEEHVNELIDTINSYKAMIDYMTAHGTGASPSTDADGLGHTISELYISLISAELVLDSILHADAGGTEYPGGPGFTGFVGETNWDALTSLVKEHGGSDPLVTKNDFDAMDLISVQAGFIDDYVTAPPAFLVRKEYNGDYTDNNGITTITPADVQFTTGVVGPNSFASYTIPVNAAVQARANKHVSLERAQVTCKAQMNTEFRIEWQATGPGFSTITARLWWTTSANFSMRGLRYLIIGSDR